MKVLSMALNHIVLELDNGELIDVNDGTSVPKGVLTMKLQDPTTKRLIVMTSITYDASVRLGMD